MLVKKIFLILFKLTTETFREALTIDLGYLSRNILTILTSVSVSSVYVKCIITSDSSREIELKLQSSKGNP